MRIGLLRHTRTLTPHLSRIIDAASNPQDYAHDLYAHLRDLDQSALDMILIESPPDTPEWAPIWDRLKKSAAGAGAASHS
jgi:L-threonylcarbamoyladenylate synthase